MISMPVHLEGLFEITKLLIILGAGSNNPQKMSIGCIIFLCGQLKLESTHVLSGDSSYKLVCVVPMRQGG